MKVTIVMSELQTAIMVYAAGKIGASGGIRLLDNQDYFEIDEEWIKPLLDFITWDYMTHTAYHNFICGKLSEAKYNRIVEAGSGINKAVRAAQ